MARTREQVIELLAKLKEITFDNGATLEESKTAAAHVERLLAEHNLTMFDVETQEFKEDVTEEYLHTKGARLDQWVVRLSSEIGNSLNCRVFYRKTLKEGRLVVRIAFIGHQADASVASTLYENLSRQLYTMGSIRGRENGRIGAELITYRSIFIRSAAREIGERLRERQKMSETLAEVEEKPNVGTQMVHVKSAAVDRYIENTPTYAKAKMVKNQSRTWDVDAARDGREAGQDIPLQRELGGKNVEMLT